ncbi:MAG: DNA-3-methyladenine glycosylase 2 family protein [Pseudomonadota bacterium]
MRELQTDADIAEGVAWLAGRDAGLARAARATGPVRIRQRADGFSALLSTIVGQQVSVASADAVWARLDAAGLTGQDAVAVCTEADLKGCGLSRQKTRYALALAQSGIDFNDLHDLSNEGVIAALVTVLGIGRWTAEIYAMFALGRRDVFAAGDLALQEAVRVAYDLDTRPAEKALRAQAEAWSPWRTVAATLLWQYYAVIKSREGVRSA